MANPRVRDMTTGSVPRVLISFAIPLLFSRVLQNVYNLVDATLAGHLYGETALAAIGASGSITGLLISLATGMNGGFELVLARAFGSHDENKFKRAIFAMLILNLAVSAVIGTLSCIFIQPLLRLMNTPDDIFRQTTQYIVVLLAGVPITALYNMEASLMRSLGNSRTPLLFLLVATVSNIFLDLLFIAVFDWGVLGIALATITAQAVSVALCFVYILKHYPELHFKKEHTRSGKALYSEMLATGASMALMSSIFSIGSVCIQSAINSLGTLTITGYTAGRKLAEFMNMPQIALAQAHSTLVSQNYGAGKISRCRQSWRSQILFSWISAAIMILLTFTVGPILLKLISGSENAEVLDKGLLYLRIENCGLPILAVLQATRMYMQGVGKKVVPIISSTIELVGKLAFTWIIIPYLGYLGVCLTEPVLWLACVLFLVGSYIKVNRSLKDGMQTI